MKCKLLLLVIMLTAFIKVEGQDTLQHENLKSVVTLSLLSPTITYAPRYNAGYMYRFANRWWAGIEAGYGNDATAINMTQGADNEFFFDRYKLFEIRPEIFYSLRNNPKIKHLVSAEYFYIRHTDTQIKNIYNTGGPFEYRFESADYKRIKTGININYTLLFYFTEKFGLLTKTGFGIKRRDVSYTNVKNPVYIDTSGNDDEDWFGIYNYLEDAGTKTNANFNFDLKLFYRF
ncbi:hypothetical protein KJK34_09955 [Flavobacterium sp. D11R37]|uniref:hypothetical protein n=1 Tax=Flavobacterium coralii TaxID=2838017 RepID=UPI001CA6E949|nr:hypothetical protein [Flavobacterium coralii]MBY8963074.1 hypothetical protein [Flavobacterium coralii]